MGNLLILNLGRNSINFATPFDTDSDGYDDVWEREMFSDLDTFGSGSDHNNEDDPDNDGLTNQEEMMVGTNPLDADTDGDGISDGQEKGDIIIPENFTVIVPEKKEGDLVSFGYELFGEMYWYDKNTGNWTKYTLTATGSLDASVQLAKAEDGFGVQHQAVLRFEATQAQFIIKYQDHEDTDITVNGNLDIKQYSYIDINSRKQIKSITDGHVEVSQLPQASIPIPIEFDGTLRSYPNPNLEQRPTLDEQVFEGDEVSSPEIERDDSGTVSGGDEWIEDYKWEAESAEKISGYDTLKINVTNKLWEFLDFQRTVWIANEVPTPVKVYFRTNSSWDTENNTGHIIIENTRTIRDNGYTPGVSTIQWVEPKTSGNFLVTHDLADFEDWDYIPTGGDDFEDSSFMFKPEDAVDWVLDSANTPPDLKTFMSTHSDLVVTGATHSVERTNEDRADPSGKAGTYFWNISIGEPREDDEDWEDEEDRDRANVYQVLVQEDIDWNILLRDYDRVISLVEDHGTRNRSAEQGRSELPDDALTMATSEKIFYNDPEIRDKAFNSEGRLEDEITYSFWVSSGSGGSPVMLESITGITIPTSEFSWSFQQGKVIEEGGGGGDTFGASVDAETGLLQYVIEVSGTNIYGIFG